MTLPCANICSLLMSNDVRLVWPGGQNHDRSKRHRGLRRAMASCNITAPVTSPSDPSSMRYEANPSPWTDNDVHENIWASGMVHPRLCPSAAAFREGLSYPEVWNKFQTEKLMGIGNSSVSRPETFGDFINVPLKIQEEVHTFTGCSWLIPKPDCKGECGQVAGPGNEAELMAGSQFQDRIVSQNRDQPQRCSSRTLVPGYPKRDCDRNTSSVCRCLCSIPVHKQQCEARRFLNPSSSAQHRPTCLSHLPGPLPLAGPSLGLCLYSSFCSAIRVLLKRLFLLPLLLLLFLLLSMAPPQTLALDLEVRVVLVERCSSSTFSVDNVDGKLDQAVRTLQARGVASHLAFKFTQNRFCHQKDALNGMAAVFGGVEQVVIGVAPYEVQTTFAMLASLYRKPFVSANSYLPGEDRHPFLLSLQPTFHQVAAVLQQVLTQLRWQELIFVASDDDYWLSLATELHVQLAGKGFRVKDLLIMPKQFTVEIAEETLKGVPSSAKAVLLMMSHSDLPNLLDAVVTLKMVTSHGYFVTAANPYQWEAYRQALAELGRDPGSSEVLDSVFLLTVQFSVNQSLSQSQSQSTLSSRDRRSAGQDSIASMDSSATFARNVFEKEPSAEDDSDVSVSDWWKSSGSFTGMGMAESEEDEEGEGEEDEGERGVVGNGYTFVSRSTMSGKRPGVARMFVSSESRWLQEQQQRRGEHDYHQGGWSIPSPPSHSRRKRTASVSHKTELGDMDALLDVVLTLGYSIPASLTSLPQPSGLLPLVASLDFQGQVGQIVVSNDSQRTYDAALYDYDDGQFVRRVFFSPTSPDSWTATQNGNIVWPNGQVLGGDECFMEVQCETTGFDLMYLLIIFGSAAGIAIIVTVVVFFIKRYWTRNEMAKGPNKIILSPDDLVFMLKKDIGKGSKLLKSRTNLIDQSKPDLLRSSDPSRSTGSINELSDFTQTARYNGDLVHVKELNVKNVEIKTKTFGFVRMLRDLRHENVNPYVGLLVDPERPAMVMEYCSRGSLKDMLHNEDIKLDWDFKLSLLTDLVRGLKYIHNTPLKVHGHLTSCNCVIDSRFVLKITDYGITGFLERLKASRELEARDLLWTAPELLRDELLMRRGTDKGDVYSMSIVFQEVALRSEPYSSHSLTPEEIIKKVRKPPPLCRPSVSPQAAPPHFIQTMKQCWSEMPDMRPSVEEVYEQFKKLTGGKKANIVDTMFKMLEKYSNDLEDIVTERTEQLEEEKKKTDQLLFRMLPPTVAESLKSGRNVQAETFSDVTIYFSDIVGFTTISALSTPMQVVDLLNDLYTMFDATIERYDVYKVETIGDAYMVVSGLPLRNGRRHAGEISTMALDLLSQCGHFTIKHMPHVPLRLRIGLHSGSCVAGVVGLTMPRYCLFGDTVNTASRMESTGAAFRIHVSQVCKDVLDELGGYHLEYRGETELKGKGIHVTWWLVGREGKHFELPEPPALNQGEDNHGLNSLMPTAHQLPSPGDQSEDKGRISDHHQETEQTPSAATDDPGLCLAAQGPEGAKAAIGGKNGGGAEEEEAVEHSVQPPQPPMAPQRRPQAAGDAGFDSGRGESSDGDSPQSPKVPLTTTNTTITTASATATTSGCCPAPVTGALRVCGDATTCSPSANTIYNNDDLAATVADPATSKAKSSSSSSSSAMIGSKSPRRARHVRGKGNDKDKKAGERGSNRTNPGSSVNSAASNSVVVVTRAEIYCPHPQSCGCEDDPQLLPPSSSSSSSCPPTTKTTSSLPSASPQPPPSLPPRQTTKDERQSGKERHQTPTRKTAGEFFLPAQLETVNEVTVGDGGGVADGGGDGDDGGKPVVVDALTRSKLERRETGDSGVDVKARSSVVSASEVTIHSTNNNNNNNNHNNSFSSSSSSSSEKGRRLTLEGRELDSLTPVTEV